MRRILYFITIAFFAFDVNAQALATTSDKIKIEIKDSLLFVNGDFVSKDSIVSYFKSKYGRPSRQVNSRKYKSKLIIYDDLGISLRTHPKGNSISFHYYRFIKSQPSQIFKGVVFVNGNPINLQYTFKEIDSLLNPCRFNSLFNRSLIGTFFSFEKGLGHDKLSEINYHFVFDPKDRIGQPYIK